MSLLEFCTESKKKQKTNQVSRSQRVDHESITSRLRVNHEPTTRDKGTYRSLFDLVSLSSRSRAVAMLFAVLALSIANIGMAWGAATKTYNFDDGVALSTDWDVTTSVPTGGTAVCEITNSLSGASFSAQGNNNKYLGLAYKDKSNITITMVSKASYTDISNVTLSVVSGDNSKPTFAAYIVTASGDVEVFAATGSKSGFNTGGTNKWGLKSIDLATAQTGKLKIVTYASSSGKYAAIDDIVITYGSGAAPEPSCGETAQAELTLSSNSGTICGTGTTTFTVSGGSGTGALSVSSSDPSKATASIDGSTVTVTGVAAGSATITVTKACDATYAEATAIYSATVAAAPTANAGADKTTEPGNGVALAATTAADGCTGAWTIQSGPNTSTAQLSSTSSPTATFTPTVAGTYTLRWTVTNTSSSCSAYDEMTVSAALCSISECGNATLTYPIYTSGNLSTSNLFSGATSSNATAVSVGSSPAFTGVTVSAATKGSSANAGACYAKSTALTGKMQYSASSKSSSYYIDFPFTVNTGYTFTPCDVQVVIQPVSSKQAFTVEITNGTNVYGTSTATLNAGVMEPIIGLTSPAEMSAGNYAIRLYPHGGSSKEFRMGANVILKGTTAAVACSTPDAPTAFSAGSITSTGATFTITDAANAASYDIYYATSSTDPTEGTAAITTSTSKTKAVTGLTANTTYYAWVRSVCDADHKSDWVAASSFTTLAPPATYDVTFTLTNVVYSSGDNQGTDAATEGVAFSTVFAANSGYVLPSTITVTIGGSPATVGTGYTWNASTGAFQVPAAQVTGAIEITIAGETAPAGDCGEIIRSTFSGTKNSAVSTTTFNTTGTIGGTSTSYQIGDAGKLNTDGAYLILKLSTGTFLKGDTIKISSDKSGGVKFATGTVSTQTYTLIGTASTATSGGQPYYFVLAANADSIIVPRGASSSDYNQNPKITYVSVCRPCPECDATPAEPTAFTAGSIKSTGATFTITDAANAASYDIYYSTSNSAPDAGTAATTTSTSKTKAVTGLTANTTYYAWVRAVCDESHKSGWVAASSFTTLAPPATYDVTFTLTNVVYSSGDNQGTDAATEGVAFSTVFAANSGYVLPSTITVTIGGSPATVGTGYTWNASTGAFQVPAAQVTGAIEITIAGETAPVRDCEDLVNTVANSATTVSSTVGAATVSNPSSQADNPGAIKLNSSGYITLSPEAGRSFAAGDSLIVTIYNQASGSKTTGFKIGKSEYTASIEGKANYTFRMELAATHIVGGKVQINRYNSDGWFVAAIIKTCDVLPPCTTPELPSLSDQEVCAGNNGTTWDATITNEGALATGETVSYEWKKKGSDVVLATTATYTPTDVTAADAGIYVVTATVSKTGNSDATASAEVTLTVKFTATPMVTMTPSSIAPGETATLTATSSEGATFQWFKCDNAEGANPVNVASTATYTTPALAVGSHYYKVVATGDGTHTCGTAELIYQVEVAIPEQCHTYYWFPYDADAGTNGVTNNEDNFFSGTKTGSSNGGTYKFSVGGESLTATKNTGGSNMTITFTIPSGKTGTLGINCKGSSNNPLYLTHSSGTPQTLISNSGSYGAFEVTDIAAGTYTVAAGASGGQSWTLCGMAVKVCTACEATTMDVNNAAPTYDMSAGGDFAEPTFTVKHNGSALSPQPALSYTSSNSAIATVNETTGALTFHGKTGTVTITATYSGDGTYCSSTASYTLTINCGSEEAPKIVLADGTNLTGCNTTITLHAKKKDGTDFTGGTYQWYRNGDVIEGATDASYTVARAGTYIVTRTGACVQESTNKAVITNTVDEPTVERLVPFQYYHEDKEYSAQMKDRHLFAVHSQGMLDDKPYSMTATRVSDGADVLSIVEGALWVKQGTGAGVGTDTVMIDLNLLIDKGLAAGDEVRFVCSAIACGGISPVNNDIILKVIDQTPTLAIICSGANGDGTRGKANYVLHGDFLTGYNKADLCLQTGGTTFDNTQELPLYTALKAHYRITPVNGYAPFKLLNYEPFDLLLLTDFPKTKLNSDSRTAQATNKMDSMYVLVDYRPMLSFKTHMVAKIPSSWAVKGFTTSPTVPKTPQTHMNIVCYAHPMFNALSHLATDEVSPDHDEEGQMVYKMLTGGGYDKSKGIQGFELSDAGNFVTIAITRYNATANAAAADGTVTWTPGAEDRKLIAACERQTNIEARMILLSINADALCKLTDAGIAMVDSTLQYLLESDPLKVADCSLTFDDDNGTGVWSDEKNWAPRYNQVPKADLGARIIKPCTVDNAEAMALSIKIEKEGKLIIPATSALIVESSIRHADGGNLSAPSAEEISIAANASGSGTLILNNITEDTRASVQMYSKASTDQSADAANWRWQYIGTPFNDVTDAMTNYYGSWLYLWNNGWTAVPKSAPLEPFAGYCITHPDGARTYSMTGTLATTADQTITVPADQYMVIANSWTAPIQIDNFIDDDLKNLAARTIYFFNTGSDPNQSGSVQPEGVTGDARWAAGTYVPVPIHAAPYSGDSTISAMQGFYVVGGALEGSIHLDYDRLVRPQKTGQNIVSGPMHVRRRAAAADGEPNVLKLFVGGNRYDDRLILLEREDFTNGFDDGWDGDKWSGNSVAPALWTLRNDNTHEAVSAIPDFEGTIIGFQAGEDDEYTFRFDYSGEADAIYLLDTETKVYTRVLTGNTYTFTTADNAEHQRFVLTRSDAPQVATGVEPASDSSLKGRAKKLLIEDKLYILLNGMLYDATGKVVK